MVFIHVRKIKLKIDINTIRSVSDPLSAFHLTFFFKDPAEAAQDNALKDCFNQLHESLLS